MHSILSGKETLHNTVSICYQNAEHEEEVNDQQLPDDDVQAPNPTSSSMRSFKMQATELESYRKKARMTSGSLNSFLSGKHYNRLLM